MNKDKTILLIIFLITLVSYTLSFFLFNLPFLLSSFDSYCHISMVKSLDCYTENNCNLDLFPDSYIKDVHIGQNITSFFIFKILSGINIKIGFYILGLIHILILLAGLRLFFNTYFDDKKLSNIFLILILVFTSSFIWVGSSLSALMDLNFIAHYPKILGLGIFLLMISLNRFYEKETKIIFIQIFLFMVLITSHVLTAVFYGVFLFGSIIYNYKNKILLKKYLILSAVLVFTFFIISLSWPFFNIFSESIKAFNNFQSGKIATGENNVYNLDFFNSSIQLSLTLPLFIMAILFLFKQKRYYLILISLLLLFISISYLIPYLPKINGYWRFTVLLLLPLIGGLSIYLKSKELFKYSKLIIIFFFIVLLTLYAVSNSLSRAISFKDDLSSLNSLNYPKNGKILLINPVDSCFIQAETNLKVLNAEQGHVSDPKKVILNDILNEKISHSVSTNDLDEFLNILNETGANYVLLRSNNNLIDLLNNVSFSEISSYNNLKIYEVKNVKIN